MVGSSVTVAFGTVKLDRNGVTDIKYAISRSFMMLQSR